MSLLGAITAGAELGSALGSAFGNSQSRSDNSTSRSETQRTGTSVTNTSGMSSTSGGSSTSYDIRNMTPEGFAAMLRAMELTERLMQRSLVDYSKEQAIKDSKESMAQIFREYRESQLPQIYVAQAGGGLYNSTTGQLMANDAYARAVDLANARQLEFIRSYNQMLGNDIGLFLRALDVNKGSVKQGSESTSSSSSTVSSSTSVTNSSDNSVTNSVQQSQSSSRSRGGSGTGSAIGGVLGAIGSIFFT
jgi:hypothetical protein